MPAANLDHLWSDPKPGDGSPILTSTMLAGAAVGTLCGQDGYLLTTAYTIQCPKCRVEVTSAHRMPDHCNLCGESFK